MIYIGFLNYYKKLLKISINDVIIFLFLYFIINFLIKIKFKKCFWGLGIGDWGLGIGDW